MQDIKLVLSYEQHIQSIRNLLKKNYTSTTENKKLIKRSWVTPLSNCFLNIL